MRQVRDKDKMMVEQHASKWEGSKWETRRSQREVTDEIMMEPYLARIENPIPLLAVLEDSPSVSKCAAVDSVALQLWVNWLSQIPQNLHRHFEEWRTPRRTAAIVWPSLPLEQKSSQTLEGL